MIRRHRDDDEDDTADDQATAESASTTDGPVVIDYDAYYEAQPAPQPSYRYEYVEPRPTAPFPQQEQGTTALTPASGATPAATTALATTPTPADEMQDSIEAIRLLTALVVGGAIEGADQLVTRLRGYEQELEILAAADAAQRAAAGQSGEVVPAEDDVDRLRYAMVGFIFEAQEALGKSIVTAARLADSTIETADNVSKPFRNFFLFRPITKRVEERVDNLVNYGRESIGRWTTTGRDLEPRSRKLALRTTDEIISEVIGMLAENDDIKKLVATQSKGMVAEVRDNVRDRTVTGDAALEDIVRRIFRRAPREDLPEPSPEVQRWAGIKVVDDYEEYQKQQGKR